MFKVEFLSACNANLILIEKIFGSKRKSRIFFGFLWLFRTRILICFGGFLHDDLTFASIDDTRIVVVHYNI